MSGLFDITASNSAATSQADPFYNLAGINFQSDPGGVSASPVSPNATAVASTLSPGAGLTNPSQGLPFSGNELGQTGETNWTVILAIAGMFLTVIVALLFRSK